MVESAPSKQFNHSTEVVLKEPADFVMGSIDSFKATVPLTLNSRNIEAIAVNILANFPKIFNLPSKSEKQRTELRRGRTGPDLIQRRASRGSCPGCEDTTQPHHWGRRCRERRTPGSSRAVFASTVTLNKSLAINSSGLR